MTVIDPVSDVNGIELCRLSKIYSFPDFVKQADRAATVQPTNAVYADPVNRRYPCHTKAATWLSTLYFQEKKAELEPDVAARIGRNLDRQVQWWGLEPAVAAIKQQKEAMEKEASDKLNDDHYAIVWEDADGQKQRSCRLANALEVKTAAQWLQLHRDSFAYADRRTIARKILEKAAAYGCDLGETANFIDQQAGRGLCNPASVVDMLQKRALLVKNAEHRAAVTRLAEIVRTSPRAALAGEMLCKLAATVETIDRASGVFGHYTEILPRPEDVLFEVSFKEAGDIAQAAVVLSTGNAYNKHDFEKVSLNDIGDLMGSDFAREVADGLNVDTEKLAALISTMPRDDAEMFEKLLTDSGIPPMIGKKAEDDAVELEELARLY